MRLLFLFGFKQYLSIFVADDKICLCCALKTQKAACFRKRLLFISPSGFYSLGIIITSARFFSISMDCAICFMASALRLSTIPLYLL